MDGLPFLTPRDFPDPGFKPTSLAKTALAGGVFTTAAPGKPIYCLRAEYKWVFLAAGMMAGEVAPDHRDPIMKAIYSCLGISTLSGKMRTTERFYAEKLHNPTCILERSLSSSAET